jgi:hypothetical protein
VNHPSREIALLSGALLLAAACTAGPSGPATTVPDDRPRAAGEDRPERMLKLVLRLTAQGVVELGRVEAPNTMNRRSPDEKRDTFYRAVSRTGAVLLERGFRLETEVRSEIQGADGRTEGRRVEVAQPEFTVAVPLYDDLDAIRFYRAGPDGARASAALLGEVRR